MRKLFERKRLPVKDVPCLKERKVKCFPVIGDYGLKIHFSDKLSKLLDHPFFLSQFSKKILGHIEFIVPVISHTHKKRDNPSSSRKACSLKVDVESRGKVQFFKLSVFTEPDKNVSFDIETGRKDDFPVFHIQRERIFNKLEGFSFKWLKGRDFRFRGLSLTREGDKLLKLILDREVFVFIDLFPRILDDICFGKGRFLSLKVLEIVFIS